MYDTTFEETYVAPSTRALNQLLLNATEQSGGAAITKGLPAGSMYFDKPRLVIGGTPMMLPMFQPAMRQVAQDMRADVVISRHGFYPEALSPVVWDVSYWLNDAVVSVHDYVLCESRYGEFWLVPPETGAYLRLAADGIHIEVVPTFVSWDERNFGVCQAAKRIRYAAMEAWR
ncbi:hypothetical protein [Sphingomonas sp. ID0503]|uniref:hypothetical protein n=1 Tax=Sphingomonas sp. ID0503 TaxID=3399691 RepID=UPI003AFAB9E9